MTKPTGSNPKVLRRAMASKQSPFTGLLLQTIDLNSGPSRGLRAAVALPPDESDLVEYVRSELTKRWAAFDGFFGLDSRRTIDIWEQRAKALIERQFGVKADEPQWWRHFAVRIATRHVPGLSLRAANKKRHGAPREWNDERLAQLFADIEYVKKTRGISVRQICKELPRKRGYAKRWGQLHSPGLREAYYKAKKSSHSLLFQLVLCGHATKPGIDLIETAINLHALKVHF